MCGEQYSFSVSVTVFGAPYLRVQGAGPALRCGLRRHGTIPRVRGADDFPGRLQLIEGTIRDRVVHVGTEQDSTMVCVGAIPTH